MAVRYDQGRKRWCVEFEQAGVRVFRRLPKGCTRAQGETLEGQLRREIFDRETLDKKPDVTLQDAIDRWLCEDHRRKDHRKAQSEARQWEAHARGKLLREAPEVAQEAIQEWTSSGVLGRGVRGNVVPIRHGLAASATINRRLAMLKAVCRHAYKQGRIAENLSGRITMLREDNKREVYLTRQQVMRLVTNSSEPLKAAIMVAAYTGLRASELLALPKATSRQDTLHVLTSKTGKPRVVPVPKLLRPYLSALPLALDYWQLHKQFLVARKAAGMPNLHFHDLRHTCASWLINAGVDLYTVGKILGHSGPQTTARYAHLAHATLRDAMARLK
jgi:integrase